MFNAITKSALFLISLLIFAPTPILASVPRDVVVLIDDAGTTNNDDAADFIRSGISELLHGLTGDVQIAAITFKQEPHTVLPLQPLTNKQIQQLSVYLREADYEPATSNTAAALERAIYELKNSARESADKLIIVVGNGYIDTGDKSRDSELSAWTRGDLISEAQNQGIRLFWIVPDESANFSLIQAVTHKSGGTYFRATTPEDFYSALARLVVLLATPTQASDAVGEAPVQSTRIKLLRSLEGLPLSFFVISGLAVLGIAGTVILILAPRRNRKARSNLAVKRSSAESDETQALLKDLSGFTGIKNHMLTTTLTKISRRPPGDNTASHTIVIGDSAVSRNHALIEYRNGDHWISDMGSVNGTFVNNRRISEETLLEDGDVVRFARYEFEYIRNDKKSMGQTIFAKSRFLKRNRTARPVVPPKPEPKENVSVTGDSDPSETNKDVTLFRPKK